jgi:galactokinase/mevalonate kinase-like predicted kinase
MDNLTEKLNSTQLLQNVQALKNAGKTTTDIQSYVDNYVKTSDGSYVIKTSDKLSQPKEQSFLKNTGQNIIETGKDILETGTDIKSSFKERLSKFKEGNLYQKIGQSAGLASDVIGAGVKGIAKVILPQSAETAIKKGITNIAQPITESDFTQKILQKYN